MIQFFENISRVCFTVAFVISRNPDRQIAHFFLSSSEMYFVNIIKQNTLFLSEYTMASIKTMYTRRGEVEKHSNFHSRFNPASQDFVHFQHTDRGS